MCVMRRVMSAGVAALVLVVASGAGARAGGDSGPGGVGAAGAAGASGAVAPEADVAHHGHVSLDDGWLKISLMTSNHGPSSLEDATVRVAFSLRPVGELRLPKRCLWAGERVVLCGTGPLGADGVGRKTSLRLGITGDPAEAVVKIGTVWNGGATDRDPANNNHKVVAPATGDPYAF
ncbi:hypothetical protein QFZ82_003614 [Streptomyces sp. V4I23]|uniref:hypothetical protein n=1 Tax=Streptomyces sp. V4I23 TaxID=3042282 RepID=UPI002784081B|nr:hypothetical protein [Streptomyces sp. V4I23]MDQ1009129.1 hypothetical protein [Streptomyces sp. V4I23]